jgi:hypothetical protein
MIDIAQEATRLLAEVKAAYVVMTPAQAEFYASLFDGDGRLRSTEEELGLDSLRRAIAEAKGEA